MANLDPSKGYKGITCFAATKDMLGISIGKVRFQRSSIARIAATLANYIRSAEKLLALCS